MTKDIPISAAKKIADSYGYDQVIVIARKVGPEGVGREHCTTYGVDKVHCAVAAQIGDFLKHKVMGWTLPLPLSHEGPTLDAIAEALAERGDCPFCGCAILENDTPKHDEICPLFEGPST